MQMSSQEIVLEDLSGQPLGEMLGRSLIGFDFDGTRIVAASRPCVESFLETWAPGEAAPGIPAGRCPSAAIAHLSMTHRSVHVVLACPRSPALGCPHMSATAEGGDFQVRSRFLSLLPGERHTFVLTVGPRGRRWLAHHRGTRVTVAADGGEVPSPRVTIKAPS
jgi:hypothetical protein